MQIISSWKKVNRCNATILLTFQEQPVFMLRRQKKWDLALCIVTVFEITQQLAVQLAISTVHGVNSLRHVPQFHYWIIGQHSGPSPSLLLLPRERWKSYWSWVWISGSITPNQPLGMREEQQVTKDILWLYLYYSQQDVVVGAEDESRIPSSIKLLFFPSILKWTWKVVDNMRRDGLDSCLVSSNPALQVTSVAEDPAVASCNWVK